MPCACDAQRPQRAFGGCVRASRARTPRRDGATYQALQDTSGGAHM
ncbi:MAG TPA: hypothetical protein VF666_11415 [Pyrinomonadaceae bacterium]